MSGPGRQVVHVRLEVLDDTTLVGRRKVRPGMRELKCSHSGIVGLENGLEVEGQAIPECKFSARRAGQYPTRFGSPLFI